MKPIIIANWKSHPDSVKEALLLARKIENGIGAARNVEVVIALPFPFILPAVGLLKKSRLGAQDSFWADSGPYTGEVSVRQLLNLGVEYVILGHSERRINLFETDEMINKKVLAVLNHGMRAILCVGENERQDGEIPQVVGEQLKKALRGVRRSTLKNLVVAYEPVWAISTNAGSIPDSPENAIQASLYIRKVIAGLFGRVAADSVRVIYGGSVSAKNIGSFLSEGRMEGTLVGSASLNPDEFVRIVKNAAGVRLRLT